MKSHTHTNRDHWEKLAAKAIIGRNAFPGDELFAHLPQKAQILDLGCGTGEIAELLAAHNNYCVTAIDVNTEAISLNKAKTSNVTYILGDITQPLPFPDHTFDAIIISFVLVSIISLPDRIKLVSELMRISKTGGIFWINEGLVSDDYTKRYELSSSFLKSSDYDFFVFQDDTPSSSIQTAQQLKQAIKEKLLALHTILVFKNSRTYLKYVMFYTKRNQKLLPRIQSRP